ncbi:beta-tubulin cofactor d [Botrytis cinerea]
MDAADDDKDVRLQRESGELLEDFEKSLHPFLYNVTNKGQLRRRVRIRETDRLTALLDNFQELPQLLDPHLQRLVPILADAFITSISIPPVKSETHAQLLMPLSKAICRLLYTFCKVRGEKVIVQFLSTEVRLLDLLLSAMEKGTWIDDSASDKPIEEAWGWEERYITLLWLSQLIMAPFALNSLSASPPPSGAELYLSDFKLPYNTPGVALRSIALAVKYLSSSGKEKDAAKILLVRVVLLKDMQDLGVLSSSMMWAISVLNSINTNRNIHHINGVLLEPVFHAVFNFVESSDRSCKEVQSSAVARKFIVNIFRGIALLNLRPSFTTIDDTLSDSVDFMLQSLLDPSTPVRLAASKALSVVILKVEPEQAYEFVLAIFEMLEALPTTDVLNWHGQILTLSHLLYRHAAPPKLLNKVIVFLLKALSFEGKSTSGSSIGTNVRDAACFGIWALARRYSTAELQDIDIKSEGFWHATNTSSTIQTLATHLVVSACLDPAGNIRRGASAALQELIGRHPNTIIEALELVQIVDYHAVALRSRAILEVAVSAASLAHETDDEISWHHYGEALLEALRGWRGVGDADLVTRRNCAEAFRLINFPRKNGTKATTYKSSYETMCSLDQQLNNLTVRQVNERHGLLLFIAAAILECPNFHERGDLIVSFQAYLDQVFTMLTSYIPNVTNPQGWRRPELIAEALSCVIFHSFRVFGTSVILGGNPRSSSINSDISLWLRDSKTTKVIMFQYEDPFTEHMVSASGHQTISRILGNAMDMFESSNGQKDANSQDSNGNILSFQSLVRNFVGHFIDTESEDLVTFLSACHRRSFFWGSGSYRDLEIDRMLVRITQTANTKNSLAFSMLLISYSLSKNNMKNELSEIPQKDRTNTIPVAIHERWNSTENIPKRVYDIKTRLALLPHFARESKALGSHIIHFWDIISHGLDDYHTDPAQGDIGSRVRLEAIKGAAAIFLSTDLRTSSTNMEVFSTIFGKLLRLCTEKLDKVRTEAKKALLVIIPTIVSSSKIMTFEKSSISSYEHFRFILDLQTADRLSTNTTTDEFEWLPSWTDKLLEGYVTSAHAGTEDLRRVSIAALVDFCEETAANREYIGAALVRNLKFHHRKNEKVIVGTLETIALLLDMGLMYENDAVESSQYQLLCAQIAKEALSSRIDKCKAAIKCFGRLALVYPEAMNKNLLGMLCHKFPGIRDAVVDELWDLGLRG